MKKSILKSRFNETSYGEPQQAPEVDNNNPEEDKKSSVNWKKVGMWGGIAAGTTALIVGGVWVGKKIKKGFQQAQEVIMQQVQEQEAKPADKKGEPAAK